MHGFITHRAELEAHIQLLLCPLLVGITETLLTKAVNPVLTGYVLVSRLDRRDGRSGGGIALFAWDDVASQVVHVGDSALHERSWHIFHVATGPLLVGIWYRPPNKGEVNSIQCLDNELAQFGCSTMGTIIIGDMNVHEKSWLRYSNGTSPEGRLLQSTSVKHGLIQCVGAPTRGPYLLDLFLTDLSQVTTTKVYAGVSDHSMVLGYVDLQILGSKIQKRPCFVYKDAQRKLLNVAFQNVDRYAIFGNC